ncbi:SDR family NAD(P)-dependent oxidoreductase [Kitasatospora viridis]|uniref:3-oxoacyl-[acyl-carrier protein] reductase n=1 Tax=Kitasatospora viridis TaxID=281105 RepID=A0A561UCL1_9ACTN|nr:3-oxoacyl-ACP reductase FabG [Kitasatospora viridis]TWF97090.1 3-oxoacyl-[acyl-carrier protein] reductase [Kitasatospora viridis]
MTSARVAVVTGAGRGIGAATALRLAGDGAKVGVLDIDADTAADTVERIRAAGGTAHAVVADVGDPAQVEGALASVAAELGPPVILVNNAGVIRDRPVQELSLDEWNTVIDVNLRGPFLLCQAIVPYLREQRWGRIVNFSSSSALGNRDQANYSAAKAGIDGLTRTLAIELGPLGVTVNAVAPGYIVTDMTAHTATRMGMDFARLQQMVAAQTPVRRVGQPEDVANAVAFLVGEEAGFVSGHTLYVTGGPMR